MGQGCSEAEDKISFEGELDLAYLGWLEDVVEVGSDLTDVFDDKGDVFGVDPCEFHLGEVTGEFYDLFEWAFFLFGDAFFAKGSFDF